MYDFHLVSFHTHAHTTQDIYQCRLKLILGLVWTIILRYQIRARGTDTGGEGAAAGSELLKWVQLVLEAGGSGVKVNNFTTGSI